MSICDSDADGIVRIGEGHDSAYSLWQLVMDMEALSYGVCMFNTVPEHFVASGFSFFGETSAAIQLQTLQLVGLLDCWRGIQDGMNGAFEFRHRLAFAIIEAVDFLHTLVPKLVWPVSGFSF